MPNDDFAKIMEEFNELYYTEENLDRKKKELADRKQALEAEAQALETKERQLEQTRKMLLADMTQEQKDWEELQKELEELLYGVSGIVTQLHDGYVGPFSANERIKALCSEARKLIDRQGYADKAQFNFFVLLIWELSVRLDDRTSTWLTDYMDELTDIIMLPEE